jgi:ribosomal-protein-alanine N-acetyltransferase
LTERQQPLLTTERLLLRPFQMDDAAAVQHLAGGWEVADTTLRIPHPYPDGAAEAWIAPHAYGFASGRLAVYAVTDREGDRLMGAIGLEIQPEHALAELGYWLGVSFWGRGYATEAACALLRFGFGTLRLNRIQGRHFVRNPASGHVLRKVGMRHEGMLRQALRKWDRFEDVELYARLADDADPSTEGSTP